MRKFLAILLAVLMTASLSVVGFAEEGIQPYGGGGGDDLAGDWILLPGVDTSIAYHTLDEFLDAIGPYTLPKTLQVGQTVQLKCYSVTDVWSDPRNITITPSTKRVTWVSGDTNILTVSSSGLVTAVGTGNWQDGAALGEIFEQGNQFASYSPRVLTTDYESDPTYDNCETGVLPIDSAPDTPLFLGDWPTMRIGDTVQLALFYKDRNDPNAVNQRYPGEVRWAVREMDVADRLITISNTGLLTVRAGKGKPGTKTLVGVKVTAPGLQLTGSVYLLYVLNEQGDNPVPPSTPGGNGGGAGADDDDNESPTENAANDDKTLDKLTAGESAEVKLVSGSADRKSTRLNSSHM